MSALELDDGFSSNLETENLEQRCLPWRRIWSTMRWRNGLPLPPLLHFVTDCVGWPPVAAAADPLPLTARETDAMRFVAQGKTDWEIGVILTVSQSTARFHVDNARRKLGAVNRAHAVARFIAQTGLA